MRFLSRIEEEAIEEGIQQGIQRGVLQNLRENAIEILQIRFQGVPPALSEALNNINDVSLLKQLHRLTVSVNSIAEFQQLLP